MAKNKITLTRLIAEPKEQFDTLKEVIAYLDEWNTRTNIPRPAETVWTYRNDEYHKRLRRNKYGKYEVDNGQ